MPRVQAGTVKVTQPQAYAMTLLAWGALDFKAGFDDAGQYDEALATVKWGTDYLMKTIVGSPHQPRQAEHRVPGAHVFNCSPTVASFAGGIACCWSGRP